MLLLLRNVVMFEFELLNIIKYIFEREITCQVPSARSTKGLAFKHALCAEDVCVSGGGGGRWAGGGMNYKKGKVSNTFAL